MIALPWLLRLLFPIVERARPQFRLRRALIGHLVRVGMAALNRNDYGAIARFLSRGVEIHYYPDAPAQRGPDLDPVYRGPQGYLEAVTSWKAPFGEIRMEVREFFDGGGDRIGGRVSGMSKGATSGVEAELRQFHVWQFDRGYLSRQWVLHTEGEMLACLAGSSGIAGS